MDESQGGGSPKKWRILRAQKSRPAGVAFAKFDDLQVGGFRNSGECSAPALKKRGVRLTRSGSLSAGG
jgi:hypothetical protein